MKKKELDTTTKTGYLDRLFMTDIGSVINL